MTEIKHFENDKLFFSQLVGKKKDEGQDLIDVMSFLVVDKGMDYFQLIKMPVKAFEILMESYQEQIKEWKRKNK